MVLILSTIFGTFAFCNIVLPIFVTLPKLREFQRRGYLKKRIPLRLIIAAPLLWIFITFSIGYALNFLDEVIIDKYVSGFLLGTFLSLFFINGQKKTIEEEIGETYKSFFIPLIKWNENADIASVEELRKLASDGNQQAANALGFFLCINSHDRESGEKILLELINKDFDPARVSLAILLFEEKKFEEVIKIVTPTAINDTRNSVGLLYGALIALDRFDEAKIWEKKLKEAQVI